MMSNPTANQILEDIKYLKTNKRFKDCRDGANALMLHDKGSRERRHYTKRKGKWIFCGVLSLEETANFYKENKK